MTNPQFSTNPDHRCRQLLAHAWMVRTFIKHCEESEDFPELMNMARAIFDLCRALDDNLTDAAELLRILRKKLGKFRRAVEQFAVDAPVASTHMNFQQAVVSITGVCEELEHLAAGPSVSNPDPANG